VYHNANGLPQESWPVLRSGKHSDEENVIHEYSLPESSSHGSSYSTSNLNDYNQLRIAATEESDIVFYEPI